MCAPKTRQVQAPDRRVRDTPEAPLWRAVTMAVPVFGVNTN
jgi:hypothetical protein